MRVRETGDGITLTGPHITTWDTRTGSQVVDLGAYYYLWTTNSNLIRDDETVTSFRVRPGVKRRAMKPCYHQRWWCDLNHAPTEFRTSTYNYQVNNGLQLLGGFCSNPNAAVNVASGEGSWLKAKADSLIGQKYYSMWEYVKPTMTTRANLAVFLIELQDIKRMFDILPSKHLMDLKRYRSMRSWKEALHYANNQHLSYNFGWKPFVRDIQNTVSAIQTFEERLAKFVNNADRNLTRHRRPDPEEGNGIEEVATSYPPFRVKREWQFTHSYFGTFDLFYSIPSYNQGELRLRAWLDSLGLNLTPSVLWEVLSRSFLIDWFVNVGGIVESADQDWLQPYVTLFQSCYSVKTQATMKTTVFSTLGGSTQAVTTYLSMYDRKVGIPDFRLSTDPLDADKIRLGSSLALALIR